MIRGNPNVIRRPIRRPDSVELSDEAMRRSACVFGDPVEVDPPLVALDSERTNLACIAAGCFIALAFTFAAAYLLSLVFAWLRPEALL